MTPKYFTPVLAYHYLQNWSWEKIVVCRFQNLTWRFDFPMKTLCNRFSANL